MVCGSHSNPVQEVKCVGDNIEGMGGNIQIWCIFNLIDEARNVINMLLVLQ